MKAGILWKQCLMRMGKEAYSVSVIGGADGPTSIFLAGRIDRALSYVVAAGAALLLLLLVGYVLWRMRDGKK